jgi:hypothetical protein
MLPGQNLRRGHECGLITASHAEQHRVHRDDGFSAAYVALQQAIHRRFARHIRGHIAHCRPLSRSQLERK